MATAPKSDDQSYTTAKAYLTSCGKEGNSVYDHIRAVILKLLQEQPSDPVSFFEEVSRDVKALRCDYEPHKFKDDIAEGEQTSKDELKKQLDLIQMPNTSDDVDATEGSRGTLDDTPAINNLHEDVYYLRQAGVALPSTDIIKIMISAEKLVNKLQLKKPVRFWGKVFGKEKDYYVLECEYLEDQEIDRIVDEYQNMEEAARVEKKERFHHIQKLLEMEGPELFDEKKKSSAGGDVEVVKIYSSASEGLLSKQSSGEEQPEDQAREGENPSTASSYQEVDIFELPLAEIPLPPLRVKQEAVVPMEEYGFGCNKKVYFVTNVPGEDWVQLPLVRPQDIQAARQVTRLFTGNLDALVDCYPAFPGNESVFLRAQIARITACTHCSPRDYFIQVGADEEMEEEELGNMQDIIENAEFEPYRAVELCDLENWVHHVPYILTQGTTQWMNPYPDTEEEEEEEETEKSRGSLDVAGEEEREEGLAMFTPLSEDDDVDGVAPWTPVTCQDQAPGYGTVALRCNVWQGAYAYANDRRCGTLYVGWGVKYAGRAYEVPRLPPPPLAEYPGGGGEILEEQDPSREEEEEWRRQNEPEEEEEEEESMSDMEEEEEEEEEDEEGLDDTY